jgi:MOSC domain-containing protein YiiM
VKADIQIKHLYIAPGHNFFGRHGKEPENYPIIEVDEVNCVAGYGLKGDRFFDHKENYKGQITFFAEEVYESLCADLKISDKDPSAFRRNVITRGVDLNSLIGKEFEIQNIRFLGTQACDPCYWMNQAFHPKAEENLKNRGGLRAKILSNGILRKNNDT